MDNEYECADCGEPATVYDIDPRIYKLEPEREASSPRFWWCIKCYNEMLDED